MVSVMGNAKPQTVRIHLLYRMTNALVKIQNAT
jgi:hypothetical protein